MADKTKAVAKVSLKFTLDVTNGLKGMADLDQRLTAGIEALATSLGIETTAIDRVDKIARVVID